MSQLTPPPSPPPPPQPINTTHNKPNIFRTAFSLLFFCSPKPRRYPFLSVRLIPRLLFKVPSMSHLNQRNRFPNPQSLSDWLRPRLPSDSFASWGVKPGTKNVHNLFLELFHGETSLADSMPPVRTVHVVTIRIIGRDNKVLVESEQELSDGSIRKRCRPLSEKMKPDENPESAVFRAVREELGSVIGGNADGLVRIVPGSYAKKVEERNSVSYPGLPACYELHSFDAVVEGLPDEEFCTEEEEYAGSDETGVKEKAVSVKRHYWKWVSADSVQS